MGKYKCLLESPGHIDASRVAYNIPKNVEFRLLGSEENLVGSPSSAVFPVVSIVEGGVRFPLDPLLLCFLHRLSLAPTQISINTFRIVNSVAELARRESLPLGIEEILFCYEIVGLGDGSLYYLRARKGFKLIGGLPPKDKCPDDWLKITGEYEYALGTEVRAYRLPWKESDPDSQAKKRSYNRTNLAAIETALALPETRRSAPSLLEYAPSYNINAPPRQRRKRSALTAFLYESEDAARNSSTHLPQSSPQASSNQSDFSTSTQYPSLCESSIMPRIEPDLNLMAIALGAPITPTMPTPPLAQPMSTVAGDGAHVSPTSSKGDPVQARRELRKKKRAREESQEVEGVVVTETQHESSHVNEWHPLLTHKGKPITTSMSLHETLQIAVDLSSALLLPKDIEALEKMNNKKLVRSTLHHQALALQRSCFALSRLEAREEEMETLKCQNKELHLALSKNKESGDRALLEANEAKHKAEREAEMLKAKVTEMEHAMAEMKLNQQTLEDLAYNEGVQKTTEKFKNDVLKVREALFSKGWAASLKKAGIPEDSSYYNVEYPFECLALVPPPALASIAATSSAQVASETFD
ncbi:hypothetical protein Vadar_008633 [Vaccinium darrowii]|uniref:Uncharacterized protein n=1 Tax=Vaccinium darrowii TaxID=229202 RepID=A0ACB7XZE1_9ERIC|nr:hypothetical protein Vadar_008633 [Vaccinium darrowii]